MTEKVQETREEEVARVRSYLASQSMRRTNGQLVETLQQAHQQFLKVLDAVPEALIRTAPCAGEWSTLDVLLHVRTIAVMELSSFTSVLVHGVKPPNIRDVLVPASSEVTRESLVTDLEELRAQLIALVLPVPADAHLDITWSHPDFGAMHWREWLLFARVHLLDHARQVQAITEAIVHEGQADA